MTFDTVQERQLCLGEDLSSREIGNILASYPVLEDVVVFPLYCKKCGYSVNSVVPYHV